MKNKCEVCGASAVVKVDPDNPGDLDDIALCQACADDPGAWMHLGTQAHS